MTNRAGRRNPGEHRVTGGTTAEAPAGRGSSGPAARWMAPSDPAAARSPLLAALTIASTSRVVMSPWMTSIITWIS